MLKEDTPDAVILATGAETLVLPFIKGIENPDIVYGVDCLEGTRPVGHKVLVVGGGMVGAETADFLAEQGHSGSPAMHNFSFQHDGLDYSRHMYVQESVWIIVGRVQIKVLPE